MFQESGLAVDTGEDEHLSYSSRIGTWYVRNVIIAFIPRNPCTLAPLLLQISCRTDEESGAEHLPGVFYTDDLCEDTFTDKDSLMSAVGPSAAAAASTAGGTTNGGASGGFLHRSKYEDINYLSYGGESLDSPFLVNFPALTSTFVLRLPDSGVSAPPAASATGNGSSTTHLPKISGQPSSSDGVVFNNGEWSDAGPAQCSGLRALFAQPNGQIAPRPTRFGCNVCVVCSSLHRPAVL